MNRSGESPAPPPLKTVMPVPVERLALDRRNPRLVGREGATDDPAIVAQLYRGQDLGELIESIAANGYLDIEPLIVLAEGGRLVVLEGNRRLAAVRLFREPPFVERVSGRTGRRIVMPEISEPYRRTLDRISVYRVACREDARSFIGFKHINGAAKWDSYAKARFAADWYRDGVPLAEIAGRIGDKHATVKRMVNAIYVLDQAQQEDIFDLADRVSPRLNFSHLYTALSRAPYMRFLGLESSWSRFDPRPDPVPPEKLENLGEILKWLYGSKKDDVIQPVVLSQNPHVKQLGEVLESAEGLAVLRTTKSLSQAHDITGPAEQRFQDALVRARRELHEATSSLRGFDGRDGSLMGIAEDICEAAQTIHDRMRKKMRDFTTKGA